MIELSPEYDSPSNNNNLKEENCHQTQSARSRRQLCLAQASLANVLKKYIVLTGPVAEQQVGAQAGR